MRKLRLNCKQRFDNSLLNVIHNLGRIVAKILNVLHRVGQTPFVPDVITTIFFVIFV